MPPISGWKEDRKKRLEVIYGPHFGNLAPNSVEYDEKAKSAIAFKNYFNLFRDFSKEHDDFIGANPSIERIEGYRLPYRIRPNLATQLTKWSIALEGSELTEAETAHVGSQVPLSFSSDMIPTSPYDSEKERELQEAYHHFLALYFGQATLIGSGSGGAALGKRERFILKVEDVRKIHQVLMLPFPYATPGSFRAHPIVSIQVKGYPAIFPYSAEVPKLMEDFCEWANSTPIRHPLLFAADLFLNFCHIHPFVDGNGRLGRLLCTLALSFYGIEPVKFIETPRSQYLQAVFLAQQEQQRSHFYRLILSFILQELNQRRIHRRKEEY